MLDDGRQDVGAVHLPGLAVPVQELDGAGRRPLHLGIELGDGEAALLVRAHLVGQADDLRVHQEQRIALLLFPGRVDHHDAPRHGHLHGREPDARRLVHGLQHVVHQPAHVVVDTLHGRADLPQQRVRYGDDLSFGHG